MTITDVNNCTATGAGTLTNPTNCAPPVAVDDIFCVLPGILLPGRVATNDFDPDDTLAELTFLPLGFFATEEGSIKWDNSFNGPFSFSSAAGFTGTVAISYRVCDPTGLCNEVVLFITVQPEVGDNNADEFCENAGAVYDLTALLSADTGGDWAQTGGTSVNITDPANVDFSGAVSGTYTFSYTHPAAGGCVEDFAIFAITITDQLLAGPGQYSEDVFSGNLYQPILGAAGQFYNRAPWYYAGTEGGNFDLQSMSANAGYAATVVDWVLVSLRSDPENGSEVLCQRAGILHNDGTIEFLSDTDCCELDESLSYYLVVEHRNHLIIMSHAAVPVYRW